jgi:hypothetical protein
MCTENHVCFGRSQLRRSECRATHSNTLATALTPLRRRRGLPRESPLQRLRACRLGYEPEPASPPSWGDGSWIRRRGGAIIMLPVCHNFLIGKAHYHTRALTTTCILGGYTAASYYQLVYVRTYRYHVMSQRAYVGTQRIRTSRVRTRTLPGSLGTW